MESKLLSAIALSRESYSTVKDFVGPEDFSPQGLVVFNKFKEFYETDPDATKVDLDIVLAKLERDLDNPKHFDMFKTLIKAFPHDISSLNVAKELLDTKRHGAGSKLAHALISGESPANLRPLLDSYVEYLDSEGSLDETSSETGKYDVYGTKSVEDLLPSFDEHTRIPLYPSSLNDRIGGGALPGHHAFIFGRPEIGKTLNAINLARRPCSLGKRGLYLGNEDPMDQVIQRAICSFSGLTWDECTRDPGRADRMAAERGFGNLTFVAMYPGTVQEIRELVHKHRPDFIIIDQVTNLTAKEDNFTLQLGRLMRGIRNVCKRYGCVGISFAQAGDSADGKLILDMGDVDWSNTSMQAACDLMIGVGMDKEYEARDWRMFSLCKNKLSGDHSYFPVEIDRKLSRVKSL